MIFFPKGRYVNSERINRERISEDTGQYRFVTDVGYYYFTSHEGKYTVSSNFLNEDTLKKFPLKVGNWVGEDVPHNFPGLLHYRLYKNQITNSYLWFISVYGTHESQFHTAEVCYIVDGWDVVQREVRSIKVDDQQFRVKYMRALMDDTTHVGVYWYMWKNTRRRMRDGTIMIRLAIQVDSDKESAMRGLIDFISEFKDVRIN